MSDDLRPLTGSGAPAAARTDSLTTLVPGVRVGKYEIVEVLGAGAFGITYRARDTLLGRDVALKEYLPVQFAARQADLVVLPRSTKLAEVFLWGRERFLAEAQTLAHLTGAPGVVNVFEFLEANGTAYMVMALVRGETMEARLERDGYMTQPALARLLPPLLDGLERVHQAGFLHRDIKPGNILIDAEGLPTLIDFGASRAALLDRTQAMTAVYTPGYAAFEQVTSAKQGPYSDIYGLAATLYHCIAGRQPPSVLERLGEDRLVPAVQAGAGRYDPALLAMIDAGLAVRPEHRPQSIAQWRALLSGTAAPAFGKPEGMMTRVVPAPGPAAPRPGGRGRGWLWAVAAVVLLCLAGGGYVGARQAGWLGPAGGKSEADLRREAEEAAARKAARDAEDAMWRQAKSASTRQALQAYIDAYPEGRYVAEARALIKSLDDRAADAKARADEDAAWNAAKQTATIESYRAYLARYPSGRYVADAQRQIAAIEQAQKDRADAKARADEDAAWTAAKQADTIESYRAYLARYPSGRYAADAQRQITGIEDKQKAAAAARADEDAWRDARKADTEAAYRAYLERFPAGRYAAEAKQAAEKAAAVAAGQNAQEAEAALKLSELDRRHVQVALSSLGHDTGGADGAFGPRTRQMIAAWQKKQNEPDTGYLTAAQVALLRKQAEAAITKYDEDAKRRDTQPPPPPSTGGPGNRDCPQCPEMVRLRPGAFLMGSLPSDPEHEPDEVPQHRVAIGYAFSLGKYEVTRAEFAAFVQATGHQAGGDWRNPGFAQTDRDPVVNVTWEDARAYAAWLARTTGKRYRLPSESEWEYAARAGTTSSRYWGDSRQDACRYANADDAAFGCSDGFKNTAPVGRFLPNAFGLHDMLGNVWEWTEDCWIADYNGAPATGEARVSGDCSRRSVRGGSWGSSTGDVRSAGRTRGPPGARNFVGFRVARAD